MGVSLNAGSVARSPGCVTLSVKIFIFIDISIFIWLDFASYRVGGAPVTAWAGWQAADRSGMLGTVGLIFLIFRS